METSAKLTEIIEQLKVANQNENEPKVSKISRLEIIFMEILQVLKTNIEDSKQRAKIERTFQEERDYESEKRHDEFLEVLKQFVSLKPEKTEDTEKKEDKTGGILDFFKNMIRGLVKTIKALFTGTLKLLGKLLKFTVFLSKKLFSILKKLYTLLRPILKIFRAANVIAFLRMLASVGWPAILAGIYAGVGAYIFSRAGEIMRKYANGYMPETWKLDYKEAYNVLEFGDKRDVEYFVKNIPNIFETEQEIQEFEKATPENKLQLFVIKAKQLRRKQLLEKEKNEAFLSPADLESLKKIRPDLYLTDDEKDELKKLETEPDLPKIPEYRSDPVREAVEKNSLRRGLTNDPHLLFETTQEEKRVPYYESNTPSGYSTTQLKKLMDQKNDLMIRKQKESNAKRRATIQEEIDVIDDNIRTIQNELRKIDTRTPPSERPQPAALTRDQASTPVLVTTATPTPAATATPTRSLMPIQNEAPTPAVTATPMPAIHMGEQPPTTGPNSFEEMDKKPAAVESMTPSLPLPSEATSYRTPTKIERNPYEIDNTQESLRSFINYNESMRLKNDLLRMSEEYEELGRILKGVSQQPVKPVDSSSPISRMFNERNIENINLQLQNMFAASEDIKPIVNNNGRTEVIPDVPLSVEASQRDDTHTLSIVLNRYKRSYV